MSASGRPEALADVIAWVVCLDSVANAKAAITARIEKHGGKATSRLSKDVSHVVFERRRTRKPAEIAQDEAELLELFKKLDKVGAGRNSRQAVAAAVAPALLTAPQGSTFLPPPAGTLSIVSLEAVNYRIHVIRN